MTKQCSPRFWQPLHPTGCVNGVSDVQANANDATYHPNDELFELWDWDTGAGKPIQDVLMLYCSVVLFVIFGLWQWLRRWLSL